MNKYIKYIIIGQILIFSSMFAQGITSASVEIRLKIVKKMSAEISGNVIQSERYSKHLPNSKKESLPAREIIVDYSDRQVNNLLINDRSTSNNKTPEISIFDDNFQLAQIKVNEQISLENSLKSDNLRFLYFTKPQESHTVFEPQITIVY